MYFCTGIFRTCWIFGTLFKTWNTKGIIYLVKKKKRWKKSKNLIIWSGSLPSLYNAIRLYVEAEASHESCTEMFKGTKVKCCHCSMCLYDGGYLYSSSRSLSHVLLQDILRCLWINTTRKLLYDPISLWFWNVPQTWSCARWLTGFHGLFSHTLCRP